MLGNDIAGALPTLRAEAESLMRDTAVVERSVGQVRDPDNGQLIDDWQSVAEIPVRVVRVGAAAKRGVEAGQTVDSADVEFRTRWDVADLRIGDRVRVTTGGDSRLQGVPVTVSEVEHLSFGAVSRRFKGVLDEDRQF